MRLPCAWATSATAATSASVITVSVSLACGMPVSPDTTSLMMSTPSRISSRVTRRNSSGPSATSPKDSRWGMCSFLTSPRPLVTVIQGVQAISLGPGISPVLMALRITRSRRGLTEPALMHPVKP